MLKGKTAIITGSSKGIGAAMARAFGAAGANVVVSGRNEERTEAVRDELLKSGSKAISVIGDISVLADAATLVDQAVEAFGQLDVLVNNAGITRDGLLMRMKEEDWDTVMAINLKGAFNCIKSATRQMMKQRYGRIINVSSVVGIMGNAGQANYAASKAGMFGLTRSVARELASRNITCNAIAPGFIETDMTDVLDEKVKADLLQRIPLGRLGSGDDVAQLAIFLASDQSAYLTGQVINIDGGMVMG